MNASTLVQKLWNYCNVLRDDGMSYGDYVEQLTYVLFLKMADECSAQGNCMNANVVND
jgi:type I restriction enzyme M protein